MLADNLTFPEALERIAEQVGVTLRQGAHGAGDARAEERSALYKLHEAACKFYASQLTGTAEGRAARAYLVDRGLKDETIARFRLGYASRSGKALESHLAGLGFEPKALEKSGLVLRDSAGGRFFDRFRGRILFPISNESGKVIAFGGRALGEEQPKYLNSPETPIYTKSRILYHLDQAAKAVRKQDYAILVEGYMDCIAVESCGVENVVASCGTSLTEAHIRLLARYSRRVVVNYDPDSAGMAATERSLGALLESGFEVKVLALPGGLDPDSFVRRRGEAEYRRALEAAPGYIDYVTDRAVAEKGLDTPQGKLAVANAVLPYLARVPNPIMRRELTDRLAARAMVDDRLLREELKRAAVERRPAVAKPREHAATLTERKLLRLFLENEQVLDELLPELVSKGALDGLATKAVFEKILEMRQAGEDLEIHRLGEHLGDEKQQLVHECLFSADDAASPEDAARYCAALRRRKIERELGALNPEIAAAGRSQDWARLATLHESKVLLMNELARIREN